MSKKGTYNSRFFGDFGTRIYGTPIRFGILVGTELEDGQRDALFAAPTPPPPSQGTKGAAAVKDVAALLRSSSSAPGGGATSTFADWATEHIAQLRRLLPGGLEPCGCFAVVPGGEAAAKDLAPLLGPVLRGIEEPWVLVVDASRRLSFWQHVGGARPALRPAQVKPDSYKEALLLHVAAHIDLFVPRPSARGDGSEGVEGGGDVDASKETEAEAQALADLVRRELSERLDDCLFGMATTSSSSSAPPPSASPAPLAVADLSSDALLSAVVPKELQELRVELLHTNGGVLTVCPPSGGHDEAGEDDLVRQRCLVVATALVLRRSTELRRALALLRADLIGSSVERLRLALDEVAAVAAAEEEAERKKAEEKAAGSRQRIGGGGGGREGRGGDAGKSAAARPLPLAMHLPWRALARPAGVELPVWCGDYCMHDEVRSAAIERLGELLGAPAESFEAPPKTLDEWTRIHRDFRGTYTAPLDVHGSNEAASTKGVFGAGLGAGAGLPGPACAAAAAALLLAAAIPLLLRAFQ